MKTSVTLARSPFGMALTGTLALAVCCISCSRTTRDAREDANLTETAYYQEPYRPQYHFSPQNTWTNDPNGLLWYDGEYHLFYQNNPFGDRWGHMSWGHAVSPNLLHWEHLPLAIPEEGNEMIFSGSAVVDYGNRSGLCGEGTGDCMVAIYTSHISQGDTSHQYQSLAFSSDRGRTWRKYEGNPVLDLGLRDFRDPKVFWHEPSARWVMVVSLPQQHTVQIYNSANLTEWSLQSEFGRQGDTSMIWECPDLLEVPVEGGGSRWVLIISSGSRHPGVVGMQYFVGEFDGRQFRLNEPHPAPRWVDYGKDFYAAVTFNQLPAGEAPVLLGWANSWTYANDIPTTPWRGAMSIPRRLSLRAGNAGLELVQVPVLDGSGLTQDFQLESLYSEGEFEVEGDLELGDLRGESLVIRLRMQRETASDFGIRVLAGDGEETAIGYDSGIASLYFDRTRSGRSDFHPAFASRELLPMELEEGERLNLLILVDRSLIEVFAEGGRRVMTGQVFPTNTQQAVQLYAHGGRVMVESLEVFGVPSAWKTPGN